jgi:hypothetical protein
VVIGGVLSSTLMTLLVLPVLYHFFGPALGPARAALPAAEGRPGQIMVPGGAS